MIEKKDLADVLAANTAQLLQTISKFDAASFNRKPLDGGWSAGEVTEHLLLFDIRLNNMLAGAVVPVNRDPEQNIPLFTARLQDRDNKLSAPPFLVPSGSIQDPKEMMSKIKMEREKVMSLIEEKDLALVNTESPHRFFGEMSALEWIVFVVMHTQRHFPQMEALIPLHNH